MSGQQRTAPPAEHRAARVGNLTRHPELRFAATGRAWATTGLAVTPRVRADDGSRTDGPTEFVELVCFGEMAEHLAASLTKGARVIALGRVETDTWLDKTGAERSSLRFVADEVGVSLRFAGVERAERTHAASYDADDEPF